MFGPFGSDSGGSLPPPKYAPKVVHFSAMLASLGDGVVNAPAGVNAVIRVVF